uniref:Chromosome 4 open reading frame 19 n=1 Tax=Anas zonorhyncha TaxID=75864 RepID=A0A8B9VRZ9_9AVES
MGCRCCKMIQSYIFDPEEVQSPGCIHEAKSCKRDEQSSNKFKFKHNSEIQDHKNELQKDELNGTEHKNRVNSTQGTLGNHGGNASQEDGLGRCLAKPDVAVNGGSSCAGAHPGLGPNTNPVKEASEQGTSSQSAEPPSASTRDFHTHLNGQELDIGVGSHKKAACNEPNSIQDGKAQAAEYSAFLRGTAMLETKNTTIQLPDIDCHQNGNRLRNYVEKDSFPVNCVHSDQVTRPSATQVQGLCVTPPSHAKESSIEPFKTDSAGLSKDVLDGITAMAVSTALQAPPHPSHKDINGEIEEEDAEVAAALAALEAATAGEDLEDDDEY